MFMHEKKGPSRPERQTTKAYPCLPGVQDKEVPVHRPDVDVAVKLLTLGNFTDLNQQCKDRLEHWINVYVFVDPGNMDILTKIEAYNAALMDSGHIDFSEYQRFMDNLSHINK